MAKKKVKYPKEIVVELNATSSSGMYAAMADRLGDMIDEGAEDVKVGIYRFVGEGVVHPQPILERSK